MLKITLKLEFDPDENAKVSMSSIAGDLISLNEEAGSTKKRYVLQFKKINIKDGTIEFDADDAWDVKENLIAKLKQIEDLPWVNKIIEYSKEKK